MILEAYSPLGIAERVLAQWIELRAAEVLEPLPSTALRSDQY